MVRLSVAILGLVALALAAGLTFQFDPSWLVFAIFAFGIFMVGRIGGPPLPRDGRPVHWGSGHGIYFDGDDVWVSGGDHKPGASDADRRGR